MENIKDADYQEYGKAIYLNLNGNNITVTNYWLRTAIQKAHELKVPLYVNGNSGSPKDPPPCPPVNPNCHG